MTKENYLKEVKLIREQRMGISEQLEILRKNEAIIKGEYLSVNRELIDGEKVEVIFDGGNKEIGFIRCVSGIGEDGYISYKVAKMKKDGTHHGRSDIYLGWRGNYKITKLSQPD